jgi:hypothetical protein
MELTILKKIECRRWKMSFQWCPLNYRLEALKEALNRQCVWNKVKNRGEPRGPFWRYGMNGGIFHLNEQETVWTMAKASLN